MSAARYSFIIIIILFFNCLFIWYHGYESEWLMILEGVAGKYAVPLTGVGKQMPHPRRGCHTHFPGDPMSAQVIARLSMANGFWDDDNKHFPGLPWCLVDHMILYCIDLYCMVWFNVCWWIIWIIIMLKLCLFDTTCFFYTLTIINLI